MTFYWNIFQLIPKIHVLTNFRNDIMLNDIVMEIFIHIFSVSLKYIHHDVEMNVFLLK